MSKAIIYIPNSIIGECLFIRYDIPQKRTDNGGVRHTGLFKCKCGVEFISVIHEVKRGKVKSCGCFQKEIIAKRNFKHGLTKRGKHVSQYSIWQNIIDRCENENCDAYKNYGGRGVKVCERWINSFVDFYTDMGERPSKLHSVDRIDNNGNYEPSNCRWGTKKEQSRNTRNNLIIEFNGEKKCLTEWCEILNINAHAVFARIYKGWDSTKALTTPIRKKLRPQSAF